MLRRLSALAFTLVVIGCGGNDDPITPPDPIAVSGSWAGTFPADGKDVSLELKLADASGTVTGSGTLVTSAGSFPLTVTGTYDSPRLSLLITTPGFDPVSMVALVAETSMTGTIGGGGFSNETLTLSKE